MERVAVFPLAEVLVPHQPADPSVIVSGTPTTGSVSVTGISGVEVGVWEMSSGAVRDVEAEEVFLLLSGHGVIELADGAKFEINAGDLVRLAAGTKTVWHVDEPLRKVYITGA
ncbi:cupin domain-containing protein [Actinoplanes sp. NPDC023936]|uniref:cupin domain-containing protein n=1 Tax=Actinoplanes sp. NPDC023936 TaxID=3154910 RepID=UPI00340AB59E